MRLAVPTVLALLTLVLSSVGLPATIVVSAQTGFDCPHASSVSGTPSATPEQAPAPEAGFPAEGTLKVFAASSLTDAFTSIGQDIMARHPGISITFNFAGSQALTTQLVQGAPADVFAPASWTHMEATLDAGVLHGEPHSFAANQLVIVVPGGNPAGIASPADLAMDDVRLVVAQPEVPAGAYAIEAICNMGADPATYGVQFVENVASNVVSHEEDVRAVLTKVRLGEADAGIVYRSDVTGDAAANVETIEIPAGVNVTAHYPIAAVDAENGLALAFVAYVLGPEGQRILADFGFTPLS